MSDTEHEDDDNVPQHFYLTDELDHDSLPATHNQRVMAMLNHIMVGQKRTQQMCCYLHDENQELWNALENAKERDAAFTLQHNSAAQHLAAIRSRVEAAGPSGLGGGPAFQTQGKDKLPAAHRPRANAMVKKLREQMLAESDEPRGFPLDHADVDVLHAVVHAGGIHSKIINTIGVWQLRFLVRYGAWPNTNEVIGKLIELICMPDDASGPSDIITGLGLGEEETFQNMVRLEPEHANSLDSLILAYSNAPSGHFQSSAESIATYVSRCGRKEKVYRIARESTIDVALAASDLEEQHKKRVEKPKDNQETMTTQQEYFQDILGNIGADSEEMFGASCELLFDEDGNFPSSVFDQMINEFKRLAGIEDQTSEGLIALVLAFASATLRITEDKEGMKVYKKIMEEHLLADKVAMALHFISSAQHCPIANSEDFPQLHAYQRAQAAAQAPRARRAA